MNERPPGAVRPLVAFPTLLRQNGFAVAPEQTTSFLQAVDLLGPRSVEHLRKAAVATLAPHPEQRERFDALFDMHFLGALAEGGYAVYDVSRLPQAPQLLVHAPSVEGVTALAFSPGKRRLAVATDDHRIRIWNWREKLPLVSFPVNSTCASIAFSPDGEWMANTDYAPSLVLRRASAAPVGR